MKKSTYNKYPGLKLLMPDQKQAERAWRELLKTSPKIMKDLKKDFILNINKKNIFKATPSYFSAVHDSMKAIADTVDGNLSSYLKLALGNNTSVSGVLIQGMKGANIYFYYSINETSAKIYLFSQMGSKITPVSYIIVENNWDYKISSTMEKQKYIIEESSKVLLWTLIFKNIANVEVKENDEVLLDETKKPKNICKALATSMIEPEIDDLRITTLDATWYTEYIRTEGFGVRGHWRLQHYKDEDKIIFIAPFQKHGYHRKAKLENA